MVHYCTLNAVRLGGLGVRGGGLAKMSHFWPLWEKGLQGLLQLQGSPEDSGPKWVYKTGALSAALDFKFSRKKAGSNGHSSLPVKASSAAAEGLDHPRVACSDAASVLSPASVDCLCHSLESLVAIRALPGSDVLHQP